MNDVAMTSSKNTQPLQIHTDSQTRRLYANDASIYEELPQGVAFPKNVQDIQSLVRRGNQEQFSITARSGGTSLAGQATGEGIIMDVSRHMTKILDINACEEQANVQPGVIRDTLNRESAKYDLLFGPDTATTNRCMMGGMIGNNSCGSFSLKHKTTREHILEIEAVLSDGSVANFKPLTADELEQKKQLDTLEGAIYRGMIELLEENRRQILEAYPHPEIIRRNTGYALDKLCSMQPFYEKGRLFNLAELLCGSEGTLAVTASAKVRLVPVDSERIVLTAHFASINAAMKAAVEAVGHEPAAVELVDDIILNATKGNIEQRKNRFFLEGEPKCILIIQFEGRDHSELQHKAETLRKRLLELSLCDTAPIISKSEEIDRVWELRKAGLGLLMGLGSDERAPSFCEDTAVRVKDLPAYVNDFQALLEKYNTNCVFYAHASVGELHLRPVIDIQSEAGINKMKAVAGEVADLVKKYGGSLSGEHGDGRIRAPYIEKVLGKEMMSLLRHVKEIWDPNYRFNPGKIVNPKPIDQNLRRASTADPFHADTQFNWRKEGGFDQALELCNGAGVCRKLAESGGTMCPSYMATQNEKDSTRGRANLFRQLFVGKKQNAFASEELRDALDLCLSCKACKSECPANVDMARMKAEFMQGWHDKNGVSLSERFFGQAATLYPLASKFPRFSNRLMQSPVGKELMFQLFNIHKKRTLPRFAEQTFHEWFESHSSSDDWACHPMSEKADNIRRTSNPSERRIQGKSYITASPIRWTSNPDARRKVALLIDIFTNYHEPEIGKAAVQVLEALGFEVLIPDIMELGRPQLSKGMVKRAKKIAAKNIPKLAAYADQNIPIVGIEPSEILTLRDEYLDLCHDNLLVKAQKIAANSFQFEEFFTRVLSNHPEKQALFDAQNGEAYLHGHCHAKALAGNEPTLKALSLAGYQAIELDTGCCGMAGSFGYEADHYKVSMNIGELALFPAVRKLNKNSMLCVPGFSCRHQLKDGLNKKAFHPAELLADSLE